MTKRVSWKSRFEALATEAMKLAVRCTPCGNRLCRVCQTARRVKRLVKVKP